MAQKNNIIINEHLVRQLIMHQFPQWKDLPISPVAKSGWDNRTFHLGDRLVVRMPSDACYASQVPKEHRWLSILGPLLPLEIPIPVVMGAPTKDYPFSWSVYRWLAGESAQREAICDIDQCALDLGFFIKSLQEIDPTGGPLPGKDNFYRGGNLAVYDAQVCQAIELLKDKIDASRARDIWHKAMANPWHKNPVWVHGDISLGNLLVRNGRLAAVIDFGQLAVGDPACDLAIAWTFFNGSSRERFFSALELDCDTLERARAWALWKALIVAAGICSTNATEGDQAWEIIHEILAS
jgi:aminoglycoside phosphotransferase (APT) family kinase protein